MNTPVLAVASVFLLLGCPAEPQPGGTGSYSGDLDEDPDFSIPASRIEVQTWLEFGNTSLQGAFADGPPLRAHAETERLGSCRLMEYTPSTCAPTCSEGEQCIDGTCRAWPTRLDRGDLHWTWPDGEQTLSPDGTLGYWANGDASTEGEVGIAVDGLSLTASNLPAAVPSDDWSGALAARTGDGVLTWADPVPDARVRIHMTDCVGSHGGFAAAEIECEGPDTGELAIPDAFLTLLEAGDWSHGECGSHSFERYHASTPDDDTTIRLETAAPTSFWYFPGMD